MGSTDVPIAHPEYTLELPTYYIGKTEVTNAQFRPFVEGDGYTNPDYWTTPGWQWRQKNTITQPLYWDDSTWNGDEQPVVGISWYEAVAYAHWLSAQTGHEYRLPTEAEWEKAARGPNGLIWPWGDDWRDGLANIEEAGHGVTLPVGSYPDGASPYGALDMTGNVWEWLSSTYKDYPLTVENEWGESYLNQWQEDGTIVSRGCSYNCGRSGSRAAFRSSSDSNVAYNHFYELGFRLASDSPPE
ncbi:MAG: formylglycine-generating enzyme family protein [Chloroflexaceae bacterium]|nr:formylglycine-generating enzyme family protein [Chloroflexaceae bacterium]